MYCLHVFSLEMEEDEAVCPQAVRAAETTPKSESDGEKEKVRKNADKKARDFDFASVWATSIETAKVRSATASAKGDGSSEGVERDSACSSGRNDGVSEHYSILSV